MGWLTLKEQKEIKKKFKMEAHYICNKCDEPIPTNEAPVIDPKGGYFPWPKHLPKEARHFLTREPRVTYHYRKCNPGKHRRDITRKMAPKVVGVSNTLLELMKAKRKEGYWTKEKCISKLPDVEAKLVMKAFKYLRRNKYIKKRKGGFLPT